MTKRRKLLLAGSISAFGLVALAGVIWHNLDSSLARTFDGESRELSQTAIVASLDSPMPPGKNVVWCASIQLAWDTMGRDVLAGPLGT